ncbi:MAG TPA: LacI family DNA-binding transcriptional regulator [Candidatus Limnocylindrales bacterium]|nr:LacI family DNA-binding transcriptional regulator [Candidatus Limnocylindrales bacterium]
MAVINNRPKPVTIHEVAAQAGVSIATVSRALSGSTTVASPTRERVLAAVEQLRFRPSRLGQSLAEGRHAANGIVFPDLSGPYYAEVVLGYEEVAAELGSSVLILATHGRPEPTRRVLELARRVDGMVLMGRTVPDEVVSQLTETGIPVVLLARPAVGESDTVNVDNEHGTRALVKHLARHGYQRFAFVGDPAESPDVAGRYAAFRASLLEAGRRPPREPLRCAFDVSSGRRAALRALRRALRPEVLVCGNDETALGALEAAAELGLSVPGDVAVTGWDDVMAARYAGLTTVRQPMRQLGATAARWLQERIAGHGEPVRRRVLQTQLVVRSSCGTHDHESEEPR